MLGGNIESQASPSSYKEEDCATTFTSARKELVPSLSSEAFLINDDPFELLDLDTVKDDLQSGSSDDPNNVLASSVNFVENSFNCLSLLDDEEEARADVEALNFTSSSMFSAEELNPKSLLPGKDRRRPRESLAFFHSIAMDDSTELIMNQDILKDDDDEDDTGLGCFEYDVSIGSPDESEKKRDLSDLVTKETDFSECPEPSHNPFEQVTTPMNYFSYKRFNIFRRSESPNPAAPTTATNNDDEEEDLNVFFGTPKQKELALVKELDQVKTVKVVSKVAISQSSPNASPLLAKQPQPPAAEEKPYKTMLKSLIPSPKRQSGSADRVIEILKTPPLTNSYSTASQGVKTPPIIHELRKKIQDAQVHGLQKQSTNIPVPSPLRVEVIHTKAPTPRKSEFQTESKRPSNLIPPSKLKSPISSSFTSQHYLKYSPSTASNIEHNSSSTNPQSVIQSPGVQSWLAKRKKQFVAGEESPLSLTPKAKYPKMESPSPISAARKNVQSLSSTPSSSSVRKITTASNSVSVSSTPRTGPRGLSKQKNTFSAKSATSLHDSEKQFLTNISKYRISEDIPNPVISKPSMLKPPSQRLNHHN